MKINSISFDLRDLKSRVDTSYEFVENLFKHLTTKIIDEESQLRRTIQSSSLYFHRHLTPSPDESVIEARRQSLTSFVTGSGSSHALKSNLVLDGLSLIDCVTEGYSEMSPTWKSSSSIPHDMEAVDRRSSKSDGDSVDLLDCYEVNDVEAVSSFYLLANSAGHIAIHLRPFERSVSLDVFCLSSFEFAPVCDVLTAAFGLNERSNVKIFTTVRDFNISV